MKKLTIGFALTGSFCTIPTVLPILDELAQVHNVIPILSPIVANTDTRFTNAEELKKAIKASTGKDPITTIAQAEPIGPKKLLDVLVIAPCTGNTLSKIYYGITDTPVAMAVKSHLRNDRPVVLAISTNDGLSNNAKTIGALLNMRNIYFVPFGQDNYEKKCHSLVAHFSDIQETAEAAFEGRQIQPLLKAYQ